MPGTLDGSYVTEMGGGMSPICSVEACRANNNANDLQSARN